MKAAQGLLVEGAVSLLSNPWTSGWPYADNPFQRRGQLFSDSRWRKSCGGVSWAALNLTYSQPAAPLSYPPPNTHTQPLPQNLPQVYAQILPRT